jgi:hypothetical protein
MNIRTKRETDLKNGTSEKCLEDERNGWACEKMPSTESGLVCPRSSFLLRSPIYQYFAIKITLKHPCHLQSAHNSPYPSSWTISVSKDIKLLNPEPMAEVRRFGGALGRRGMAPSYTFMSEANLRVDRSGASKPGNAMASVAKLLHADRFALFITPEIGSHVSNTLFVACAIFSHKAIQ